MCVSFCSRTARLYWNHTDCQPIDCEFTVETPGQCTDCRHHCDEMCRLTRAPLPSVAGGCCHWNVTLVSGRQEVTREMLAPLGIRLEETVEYILLRLEVPYQLGAHGEVIVNIDELATPFVYGRGTEHLPDEELDWSAWFGQWCREED